MMGDELRKSGMTCSFYCQKHGMEMAHEDGYY